MSSRGITIRPGPDAGAQPLHPRTAWRAALLLIVLTVVLAVLATSDVLHSALTAVLAKGHVIADAHPVFGALLFVLLAALSAMLAFASVAVFLPLAVVTWGEPLAILLLWTGWLLGGALSYGVGRFFGRAAIRWLSADALLDRLEHRIGPSTPFGLVLLVQLALPSEIPGYLLGLVRYSLFQYLLALGIVELLYAFAAVHLGASFVERRAGVVLATGIFMAAGGFAAFHLLRRRI